MNKNKIARIISLTLIIFGLTTFAENAEAVGLFKTIKDSAKQLGSNIKGTAQNTVSAARNATKNTAQTVKGKAEGFITQGKTKVEETTQKAVTKVQETQEKIAEKVQTTAADISEKVQETTNNLSSKIEKITEKLNIYPEASVKKIDALMPAEDEWEMIKYLDFSGKEITDEDIPYLAACLSKIASEGKKKVGLSLKNNAISSNGLEQLLTTLAEHPQFLASLSLSGNEIDDDGLRVLSGFLPKFPMLQYIHFVNTKVMGEGMLTFVAALKNLSLSDGGANVSLVNFVGNEIPDNLFEVFNEQLAEVRNADTIEFLFQRNQISPNTENVPSNIKLK